MTTQTNDHSGYQDDPFKNSKRSKKAGPRKLKYKKKFLDEWLMEEDDDVFNDTLYENLEDVDQSFDVESEGDDFDD